jgi:osmotically-inducible protein OsmY
MTDRDLQQHVQNALDREPSIDAADVGVSVENGVVAAANAVRDLAGVRGVSNTITLEPHVSPPDVKSKIEAALKRSAEIDARRINVAVTDSTVMLSGNVHSWFERDEARRAA